jgi:hypothetical protein
MSETNTTPYSSKCDILADLWMNYRADEEFQDFLEYNDLGLPIAYAISNGIVQSSPLAEEYINESFDLLLTALEIEEDTGFDSLDSLLSSGL